MKPVLYESVWNAISDTPQEAASMKARSKLMMELSEIINTRKLRQKDAAELFVRDPCPDIHQDGYHRLEQPEPQQRRA